MSRHHYEKKGPSTGSIVALIFVVIVFFAAIGIGAWQFLNDTEYDKVTGCQKERSQLQAKEQVVFLFDITDSLDEDVAYRLRLRVTNELRHYPDGTLIEFYALDDRISNYKSDYFHCIPKRPEKANAWTENAEMLKKEFDQKFRKNLNQTLEKLTSSKESLKRSPICEMIKAVVLQSFADNKVKVLGNKKIIIISDFMHHSPGHFSMYRDGYDFEKFKKSEYGSALLLDSVALNSDEIEAELWYTKKMSVGNTKFWQKYFARGGITVTRSERI